MSRSSRDGRWAMSCWPSPDSPATSTGALSPAWHGSPTPRPRRCCCRHAAGQPDRLVRRAVDDRAQPVPAILAVVAARIRNTDHQRLPACRPGAPVLQCLHLLAFAFALERNIGTARFLALYAFGLLASALGTYFKHRSNPGYRCLGASGAILAVLFAAIVYSPTSSIFILPIRCPSRRRCLHWPTSPTATTRRARPRAGSITTPTWPVRWRASHSSLSPISRRWGVRGGSYSAEMAGRSPGVRDNGAPSAPIQEW